MNLDQIFEGNSRVHLLLLLLLCYFSFFLFSESFFVNIMEARNFVTAREMIEKGNWLVPTMNGELRIAKPPFPTWITAVMGSFFGMKNLAMLRFPAGVMGCLMVLFMYQFSIALTRRKSIALTNSLILTSSFYVLYMSRTGTWDIFCHSFMLGAIWILFKALQDESSSKWVEFSLAGVLLGLSFLSKGPVAFYALLLPFLIAYCLIYDRKRIVQYWKPLLICLAIFVVISFWWPMYISIAHAEEAAAVAKLESGSWMNRHVRPFYYYWNFPIQTGVWTLLLTSAIIVPFSLKNFKNKKEYLFALIWTLSSVILLSLIPEKKDRYLLPALIPSAILAGQLIHHLHESYKSGKPKMADKLVLGLNVWTLALVAFSLPMVIFLIFYQENYLSVVEFILYTSATELMFLLLLLAWINKNVRLYLISGVLLMCVNIGFLVPNMDGLLNQNPNFKNISEIQNIPQYNKLNYYSIGDADFRIELVYEAGKEVERWDVRTQKGLPQKDSFVVFSTEPPRELFSESQLAQMDLQIISHFDYNRYHKGKRRNKPHFQKYAALVRPKAVKSKCDSKLHHSSFNTLKK